MSRRMSVIVIVLLGLMVLAVTISPPRGTSRDPQGDPGTGTAAPPAVAPAPLTDPDAFDVEADLSATPGGRPRTVDAELGDRVALEVSASVLDSVALGDLAVDAVEPGVPARFELLADTRGAYPLVLVNEGRRIGTLRVR